MTKVNKPKLFEDYLREIQEREFLENRGFSYPKNQEKEARLYMLNNLATKQAELEEKIDFIMKKSGNERGCCEDESVWVTLEESYKNKNMA